jgi:hypothetical protein
MRRGARGMTESTTRKCARPGCNARFELTQRSGRARINRKHTLHRGRRYCSDNCRKRASESRNRLHQSSAKRRPKPLSATTPLSTVRTVSSGPTISMGYKGQKTGRASLKMTFGGYTVVPDAKWPKMYRVRQPDGILTDMVNLTRARDAAAALACAAHRDGGKL